jgi:2-iminobutanoate/2-iminopropanoate deaminase
MKKIISTEGAPAAIGPYSQAVKAGNMIYTSGMLPINPVTGEITDSNITEQTEQVLKNLVEVFKAAGATSDNVVKTTVFIKNMNDFAEMNAVYKKYFKENFPSRTCVEVARLPKDALVEIECVLYVQ